MHYSPSSLYRSHLDHMEQRLADSIKLGLQRGGHHTSIELFFRADDIGVPSGQFTRLIKIFQKYSTPLCLATVPTWLTRSRLRQLRRITGEDDALWCWHQHGRMHRNYEPEGKKQEFGPARNGATVKHHLQLGKERLERLLGDAFQPFFTPPWNRCSLTTIQALQELHFHGLSRSQGARPLTEMLLPDFQVNVDLHTRKEVNPLLAFGNLLTEIETGLASGRCGIMIHHQRMNHNAYIFLDTLLALLSRATTVTPGLFTDMVTIQQHPTRSLRLPAHIWSTAE